MCLLFIIPEMRTIVNKDIVGQELVHLSTVIVGVIPHLNNTPI